ncbi:unnamed protein product [Rhizophagus irregularis]|nr:unnamed protein product [Rhizophagus irregularis]
MVRFLRSDATCLSDKDIQDIINARNSMKWAMAKKYKISSWQVYQIWRGEHPPLDKTGSLVTFQQANPLECNVTSESKIKKSRGTGRGEPSLLTLLNYLSVRLNQRKK